MPGVVVILNGPPRAGKSSIAAAIAESDDGGEWCTLGVDSSREETPQHLQPGIGLRPGGERPDLEPEVRRLYRKLFTAVAARVREGRNVIVDLGLHEDYSRSLGIRALAQELLTGLPVLLVGVRCPVDVVRERRRATWGGAGFVPTDDGEDPVQRWDRAVHEGMSYDLEVDTSLLSPRECADRIAAALGRTLTPRTPRPPRP
ncbi:chloramphenicol phosphotransferase CPT family protein [Salana multivorans]